ncbi:peptidoglycan DD-metalloendopeptidase family protein [Dyadobacter arcticus]|uniref:Murein DD-endopeptidase MepM/ murein hydrolase activator NlpD n=1 Tax=Dyadobacter arcticus TaxID=1078754 RepID=A0ABX0UIF2_9BACT|nr:M23 family metallopeptidase [Dyadobacter arcticus]NIJ51460.1 murein DD-endopeptidase MepM/ murein hydrolase activator NlpD [Dyadobacter arcticus]
MKHIINNILCIIAIFWLACCKPVPVSHWFPVTPQEHYEKELYKDKLEKTIAGQTWFRVGQEVLNDSVFSIAPYQERFYLGDSIPAQAIRLQIPEGRRLVITPLRDQQDTVSRLFVELYKIKSNGKTQRIDYLGEGGQVLTYDNYESDTLLLRLQTGLNDKLSVTLTLSTLPSLGFPVAGYNMSSVISYWGAERDRGIRSHEGIDISAKRGTPVIASQSGFITQTGTNNLGGKVVFMSSLGTPYSLYYAHLDSQLVAVGQKVTRGDTLGLVGNTGNAITTAPHLHFGIYSRSSGAVNPLPFINDRKEKIPGLPERSPWLGDTVLIRKKTSLFTSAQFQESEQIRSLPSNTLVRILGEIPKGYRVQLEDGTKGYIPTVTIQKYRKTISIRRKASEGENSR